MEVTPLAKPAGEWCRHCAVGSGCEIYDSRPQECRDFVCQWLVMPQMPDSMRPDKIKVLMITEGANFNLAAYCEPANPLAWRKEPIYGLLKRYAQQGWGARSVTVRIGLRMWLITPDEDVDLGIVPANAPVSYVKGADGRIRATVSPPPAAGPSK